MTVTFKESRHVVKAEDITSVNCTECGHAQQFGVAPGVFWIAPCETIDCPQRGVQIAGHERPDAS